ncbi:MAG: hypothetical protein Fur0022_09820 [Anaerolineales bacterium]
MRLVTYTLLVLVLVTGVAIVYAYPQEGAVTAFADACTASSDQVTTPENCAGGPDSAFVEILKADGSHYLELDMGADQEGTGDLILHYKTGSDVNITVEFREITEEENRTLDTTIVTLYAEETSVLVDYEASPTPYRYVRLYASEERKYQIDAVAAETYRPDSDRDSLLDQWEIAHGLAPLIPTGRDGPNADIDNDLLTNKEEQEFGTHPSKNDTDDDKLPDNWEIDHGLKPNDHEGPNGTNGDPDGDGLTNKQELDFSSHPNKPDTEGDGLNDLQEMSLGTNPNNDDTDGDELLDKWEVDYELSPIDPNGVNGKDRDPDQDGLPNLQEQKTKAFPNDPDSDDDGTNDKDEVERGMDPRNWDDGDLDKDGLRNGEEKNKYKTNENDRDTDDDGLDDFWEVTFSLDPNSTAGIHGGKSDPDNDGMNNLTEQANGSSPHIVDTDEDGLPDAWEIRYCLLPNSTEGVHGADGDPNENGKSNFIEMGLGTAPTPMCSPIIIE